MIIQQKEYETAKQEIESNKYKITPIISILYLIVLMVNIFLVVPKTKPLEYGTPILEDV